MSKLAKSKYFPPAELAEPEGVVLFGGRLTPAWLLDAYAHGIFPWPIFHESELLVWWSPDPRAIIPLDGLHISRRLWRTCQSDRFEVTCNKAFTAVISGCARSGDRHYNTWITPPLEAAYCRLHAMGHAHSVEVWHQGELAGGTYGVAIGGLFAGESMFHTVRDASKVAIVHLVCHLRARGFKLFDIQQLTTHTASLGAVEISRADYLARLAAVIGQRANFGATLEPLSVSPSAASPSATSPSTAIQSAAGKSPLGQVPQSPTEPQAEEFQRPH